jgi:alkanesulfonate monooxygenase SsuD/methylene tetrahydromethanopterin reductase-like flavin-dependent oxidoreductase (luciferase family)
MGAGSTPTGEFKREIGLLRQLLEEEGRDPATFTLSKRVYVAVTRDKKRESERVQEWFGKHYGNAARGLQVSVIGGEQECLEGLAEVASEGIDLLMVNPIFEPTEQAERLAQDILPKLRS